MNLIHWLHHLFNPHCSQCADDALEKRVCTSCETLKMQLSIANHEKQQMLNSLLSLHEKPAEKPPQIVPMEKIKTGQMPWGVRKRMLEAEDREAAKLLAEKKRQEEIAKLEKELNLEEVKDA